MQRGEGLRRRDFRHWRRSGKGRGWQSMESEVVEIKRFQVGKCEVDVDTEPDAIIDLAQIEG